MSRAKILKIATKEFSKLGYDGLSMNKLAAKVGLNKATIYHHFKDKRELYNEIIKTVLEAFYKDINYIKKHFNKPQEKLKHYVYSETKLIIKEPHIIPLILRETANFGANTDKQISDFLEQEVLFLKTIFQELPLKEHYKDTDIYSFKLLITGTVMNYYSLQKSSFDFKDMHRFKDEESLIEYLSNFITNILFDLFCQKEAPCTDI